MWCRVTLVRTEVSEESIASIFRVKIICEIGTLLTVTSNCSMLWRSNHCMIQEAIEWDIPQDGRERELLVTVSLSSCLSFAVERWQAVASQWTLSNVSVSVNYGTLLVAPWNFRDIRSGSLSFAVPSTNSTSLRNLRIVSVAKQRPATIHPR
jgi:hypothetical protein